MRSSHLAISLAALAASACATAASPCTPLMSWATPAFGCGAPTAPAVPEVVSTEPPTPLPKAALGEEKIELAETVQFETDSSVLREESKSILQAVAQVMRDHPEVAVVKVEGHTDNRGTKEHNLQLSRDRARAVKQFLVGDGIAGDRLQTEGYGESKPIADNATEDGRFKNRRVEFRVMKKK
jgi:outer membrane protein OmpA-like peptidoglycan-associated protein